MPVFFQFISPRLYWSRICIPYYALTSYQSLCLGTQIVWHWSRGTHPCASPLPPSITDKSLLLCNGHHITSYVVAFHSCLHEHEFCSRKTQISTAYVVVFHSWLHELEFCPGKTQISTTLSEVNRILLHLKTTWNFWLHRWSPSPGGCGQLQEEAALATILCQQSLGQLRTMPSMHFHDRC